MHFRLDILLRKSIDIFLELPQILPSLISLYSEVCTLSFVLSVVISSIMRVRCDYCILLIPIIVRTVARILLATPMIYRKLWYLGLTSEDRTDFFFHRCRVSHNLPNHTLLEFFRKATDAACWQLDALSSIYVYQLSNL